MSGSVKSYRDLQVWQKARVLVSEVYKISGSFPREEMYGLTSQLRRAVVSVPSNIAEGSSKGSTREYIRFLNISYGSLCEAETQLYLAFDLGFITMEQLEELLNKTNELGRMTHGLLRALEQKVTLPNSELRTPNSAYAS